MSVVNARRPADAPVEADGLPVQADRASRGRGNSLLTYSQTGVTPILEAIVPEDEARGVGWQTVRQTRQTNDLSFDR